MPGNQTASFVTPLSSVSTNMISRMPHRTRILPIEQVAVRCFVILAHLVIYFSCSQKPLLHNPTAQHSPFMLGFRAIQPENEVHHPARHSGDSPMAQIGFEKVRTGCVTCKYV